MVLSDSLLLAFALIKRSGLGALFRNHAYHADGTRACISRPNNSVRFGDKIGGHELQGVLGARRVFLNQKDRIVADQKNLSIAVCLSVG